MVDLHSILKSHHPTTNRPKRECEKEEVIVDNGNSEKLPEYCEVPSVLFDEVLVKYKLTRVEILVLVFLYRKVWEKSNLNEKYGIGPVLSHTEMAKRLNVSLHDIYTSLRKLEELNFISTIRSGQYFVRKYFTEELDKKFCQNYDNF